jgi:hypothetical protein
MSWSPVVGMTPKNSSKAYSLTERPVPIWR